ncbi:hypothetical protein B0F90DRAFT_1666151 [Multifurca ochricompacta]|uniref:Uncharacterized protein n=1 Tax=Multifurca ochricompacta TaxID=376703 RepID=A0AAD4M9N3_9AGAM|nr:hypothetical protein B0F90DRAFT_1666151 [Multifurca ochricompacta]
MFSDDIYPTSSKDYIPQPLYVRQPCSLQIIQLVECSPPPPRQKYTPSRISSSSYSDSQSNDSAYDTSSSSLSDGSSYCSSVEGDTPLVPPSFDDRDPSVDDTYRIRQRRVSLWRDAVYSKNVTTFARPTSPCQKRKTPDGDLTNINNDSVATHIPRKSPLSTLSAHSCPACDEDFSSPLGLRQHASTSKSANEACRIAVEYGFE